MNGGDVLLQLLDAAGANQRAGHGAIAQHPCQRHLRQALAAGLGNRIQSARLADAMLVHILGPEEALGPRGAGVGGDAAAQIAFAEQPLRQRRKRDATHALPPQRLQQPLLRPAAEHRVGELVDQERRPLPAQNSRGLHGVFGSVVGNARVQSLAGAHRLIERAHGFLERRLRVRPVVIEDVDIRQAHAAQALVQAGQQILARAEVAVRAGPHAVAGLGGDDELVAVCRQVHLQRAAKGLFRGTFGRPVVIRQIEMGDSQVKGAAQDGAAVFERIDAAEVVPQAERNRRQHDAGLAATPINHAVVSSGICSVQTDWLLKTTVQDLPGGARTRACRIGTHADARPATRGCREESRHGTDECVRHLDIIITCRAHA